MNIRLNERKKKKERKREKKTERKTGRKGATKTIRMMTIKMKTTRYLIDQERGEIRKHRHSDRRKLIK